MNVRFDLAGGGVGGLVEVSAEGLQAVGGCVVSSLCTYVSM